MDTQNLTIPEEIWKDIPEFSGYQVSDHGRVRSFWKRTYKRGIRGSTFELSQIPQRILSPDRKHSYMGVNLYRSDLGKWGRKMFNISRLVLLTFVGPCPDGMESCHEDGVFANNFLVNLRWDTKSANSQDSIRHGTHTGLSQKGENHWKAKLTAKMVLEIRELYSHGQTLTGLGKVFGVTINAIYDVVNRRRWKHI